MKERAVSHLSISHLGVFSKWAISSSDRVCIVQQIRGKSGFGESIEKDLLMDGKSVHRSTQGSRKDVLSCIGRVGEGKRRQMGWCGRSRSCDQGCCSLASLTQLQPIKLRRTLRSFVIQKILFRNYANQGPKRTSRPGRPTGNSDHRALPSLL